MKLCLHMLSQGNRFIPSTRTFLFAEFYAEILGETREKKNSRICVGTYNCPVMYIAYRQEKVFVCVCVCLRKVLMATSGDYGARFALLLK
jgi:methylase of polypeptide subunit release factors